MNKEMINLWHEIQSELETYVLTHRNKTMYHISSIVCVKNRPRDNPALLVWTYDDFTPIWDKLMDMCNDELYDLLSKLSTDMRDEKISAYITALIYITDLYVYDWISKKED